MTHRLLQAVAASLLAAACVTGHASPTPQAAPASATVTGWAFGAGHTVDAEGVDGQAGGFSLSLSNMGAFSRSAFIAYSVDSQGSRPGFGVPTTAFSLTQGQGYFEPSSERGNVADRLGRLLTYVADHPSAVNDSDESTSLQLAVWNLVSDTDFSLSGSGRFSDRSRYAAQGNVLLAGARGVTESRFDVYVVDFNRGQDLIVGVERASAVPEPGSLALVGCALVGLFLSRRLARRA
jgi:hypothetical protein